MTRSAPGRGMAGICAYRTAGVGRVGVWRGGVRLSISVCRPFRLAVPFSPCQALASSSSQLHEIVCDAKEQDFRRSAVNRLALGRHKGQLRHHASRGLRRRQRELLQKGRFVLADFRALALGLADAAALDPRVVHGAPVARAALGLGVRELAKLAKVSPDTVARLERGEELRERTVDDIRAALEAAGVEFTNGDQPGVRLRKADDGTI
jgi:hypothetical protein